MTIQTKFDVGDYAWYLYNDSWYLVEIESILIIKQAYNVTGAPNLDEPSITYSCRWCEVTNDHPVF